MEEKEYVYQVLCEWDIGQEYQVFKTKDGAWEWAIQALIDGGIDDDVEELQAEGLVSLDVLEVLA